MTIQASTSATLPAQLSVMQPQHAGKPLKASTVLKNLDPIAPVLFAKISGKHRLNDDQQNTCLQALQAIFQEDDLSLIGNLDPTNFVAMLNFVTAYGVAERYRYSQFADASKKIQVSQSSGNFSSSSASDADLDGVAEVGLQDAQSKKPEKIHVLDLVITAHPTQLLEPDFLDGLSKEAQELRKAGVLENRFYEGIAQYIVEKLAPRNKAPTVDEEHKAAMPFVGNGMRAVHKLRKSGSQVELKFGNWIGGDRDGNPLVTADVLVNNVTRNSKTALDFYLKKLQPKQNKQAEKNCIYSLLEKDETLRGELNEIVRKLQSTQKRLQGFNLKQQDSLESDGYPNAQEFFLVLEGLKTNIENSNLLDDCKNKATNKIANLIASVQAYGFHGLSTDLRQNSSMNEAFVAAVWAKLEAKPEGLQGLYSKLTEDQKVQALTYVLEKISVEDLRNAIGAVMADEVNKPEAQRVFTQEWSILQTYGPIQKAFGADTLKHHITANNETFSDMLEVALMLKAAGLVEQTVEGAVTLGMDIMPLIETVDDMANAEDMLGAALSHDWYQKALQSRSVNGQLIQHIMVGYSDSTKGDGVMSAAWALQCCKHSLLQKAKLHDVDLAFFHGRGGSTARGTSGSIQADLDTVPPPALANKYRVTVQGEVSSKILQSKQASLDNLQTFVQGLQSHAANGVDVSMTDENFKALLDTFAEKSRNKYRELCASSEFSNYFQHATPFEAFGLTNAGSRPSQRPAQGQGLDMTKVRAIPYAAAFQQNGTLMPAWYGVGSGLQVVLYGKADGKLKPDVLAQLQSLYQQSPWFKGILDRVQVALKQVDLDSALDYAQFGDKQLGSNSELCKKLHQNMAHEFALTQAFLDQVRKTPQAPLDAEPAQKAPAMVRLARALQLQVLQDWKKACKDYEPEAQVRKDTEHRMATSMQAIAMLTGAFG